MFYLRSCYSTKARFFYDDDREDDIIWYWAADDAPWFRGRSSFAPLSFSNPTIDASNVVGEVPSRPRPWRNGSKPGAPASGDLDGEEEWFYEGQSIEDDGLDRTEFGVPVNCQPVTDVCHLGTVIWQYWYLATYGNDASWIGIGNGLGYIDFYFIGADHQYFGTLFCYSEVPDWALNNLTFEIYTGVSWLYFYTWGLGPTAVSWDLSDREDPGPTGPTFTLWQISGPEYRSIKDALPIVRGKPEGSWPSAAARAALKQQREREP